MRFMGSDDTKTIKQTIVTTTITVIVTAILTVIGLYIKQQWIDPFAFTVHVSYVDSNGHHGDLSQADVVPQINNVEGKKTNEYGEAVFQSVEPHPLQKAVIEVRHTGYTYQNGTKDPEIPIRKRSDAVNVLLVAVRGPSNSTAVVTAPAPVTSVCRSGPLPSGAGKNFGLQYELCSDSPSCSPPNPGSNYVIQSERFELVGDRICNAWSACTRQTNSTNKRVCYSFQMQGHDEWQGPFGLGSSGVAQSEGILTVTWVRQ
jgi:hypothetical protein